MNSTEDGERASMGEQRRQQQAEAKTDHWKRLPDQLVLKVFDKIPDPKFLARSSLVSKRFASLLTPESRNLLVQVPHWNPHPYLPWKPCPADHTLPQKLYCLLTVPLHYLDWPLLFLRSIRCGIFFGFRVSLPDHGPIDSLHVQLMSSDRCFDPDKDDIIKWKLELTRSSQLSSFTVLYAKTLTSTKDQQVLDGVQNQLTDYEIRCQVKRAKFHLCDAHIRYMYLRHFVKDKVRAENVVVTDSKGHGKISVSKEQLAELKKLKIWPGSRYKIWYVPMLRLPSRRVMKEVKLAIFKGDGAEDALIGRNAFKGEDKVYGQAVREILKTNPVFSDTII